MPFQKEPIIAYHNMEPTPELEADIRERIAKLEQRFDRLIGIRVSVEALHKQRRTGNVYDVHIELSLPGSEVVVSRKPHKAQERYTSPDVHTSVRDAFKAAERQLDDQKDLMRGDVKAHPAAVPGRIADIFKDAGHGFVTTAAGARLFFHANAVRGARFEDLKPGTSVHYEEGLGEGGPAAMKVWPAGPDAG